MAMPLAVRPGAVLVRQIQEPREWDALVTKFSDHDLQQGFGWGELARNRGWRPVRLAVMQADEYLAAISTLLWRVPGFGLSVMYAPRGPLIRGPESMAALAALVEELRRLARREKAVFLRVSPGRPDEDRELAQMLGASGFRRLPDNYTTWNSPRTVMWLPLEGGEQAVRARMRKSTRQKLGIAARSGVIIRDGGASSDFQDLHRLVALNARRKEIPVRPREYFETLSMFVRQGLGKLSFAEWNGTRIAAQFGVRFGRRAYFLHYGVDPRFLHLGTARALDWEHIKWALSGQCHEVDLGGTASGLVPRQTDRGYGVYQYKVGLGCEIRYLTGYYDLVFRPRSYRVLRLIEQRHLQTVWAIRSKFWRIRSKL